MVIILPLKDIFKPFCYKGISELVFIFQIQLEFNLSFFFCLQTRHTGSL